MSHFVVFVITRPGQTLDELLAPYDENLKVTPYVAFTLEDKAKERLDQIEKTKAALEEFHAEPEDKKTTQHATEWLERANKRLSELMTMSDEDYYKSDLEDYKERNENGEPLSSYNPRSKWDWFQIGGRWGGLFVNKKGEKTDQCVLGDVDWEALKARNVEEVEESWNYFEELLAGERQDGQSDAGHRQICLLRAGLSQAVSREDSIEKAKRNPITPFALLTPDGEWYERGRMGWFASVSNELPFEEFSDRVMELIRAQPLENTIINVDCHI